MLKSMFTALAAFGTLILATNAHAAETNVPREAVYRIGGYLDGGHCSSVAVGPRLVLTAEHCVSDDLTLQVLKFNSDYEEVGQTHEKLKVIRTNKKYDQALFEVMDPSVDLNYVKICETELDDKDFGKPVTAVGFPLVITKLETKGTYQGFMDIDHLMGEDYKPFYLVQIPIAGGNSGGGLFRVEGYDSSETMKGPINCLTGIATANTFRQGYESMSWFSTLKGIKETTSGVVLTALQKTKNLEFKDRATQKTDDR